MSRMSQQKQSEGDQKYGKRRSEYGGDRVNSLNSEAMTEMLCQAFSSRSSSLRRYTDPFPAWMSNTLSMSVRRSIVYLQQTRGISF